MADVEKRRPLPTFYREATGICRRWRDASAWKAAKNEGRVTPSSTGMVVRHARSPFGVPESNGAYRTGASSSTRRVKVGVAVRPGRLELVTTVFDADARGLTIATEGYERSRPGPRPAPSPAELSGGTSLSNLACRDSQLGAVVQHSAGAILAVGEIQSAPWSSDGHDIAAHAGRHPAWTTASYNGAEAAESWRGVRAMLEETYRLGSRRRAEISGVLPYSWL